MELPDMAEIKTTKELEKAIEDYEKNDNIDVLGEIGWYYDNVEKNTNKALPYYQLNVERQGKNYKVSIYNVAHILKQRGNKDQALEWLNKIADEDVDAELLIAEIYAPVDKEKSLHYFQRVIERNVQPQSAKALFFMGIFHMHGCFKFERDEVKAFSLVSQAAEQSDPDSVFGAKVWMKLSDLHHRGFGTPVNVYKATECLVRVPEHLLDRESKYNFGYWTYRGSGCIKQDRARGLDIMFELDKECGDRDAQTVIAESFRTGRNPEQTPNTELAVEWYRKAARQGQVLAIKYLVDLSSTDQEKVHWLEQLLAERKQFPKYFDEELSHCNQTINVEYKVLQYVMDELHSLRRALEKVQLQPPLLGGELYRKAKTMFMKHAAVNDVFGK